MNEMRQLAITALLMGVLSTVTTQARAGLFKLDFGALQNTVTLTDWDTLSDWAFTDFPGGIATWSSW